VGFSEYMNLNENHSFNNQIWVPYTMSIVHIRPRINGNFIRGSLISKGILTSVPLPIKGAKSLPWAENLIKLFTVKGRKFKFSA